jgi:SAM-dependent methyltransferase
VVDESHYLWLAGAYARGALGRDDLDDAAAVAAAEAANVRLHRFKRTSGLPRVRRVIGALRGLGAIDLVDLGTGRGAFLWPVLDELRELRVTCVDTLDHRALDLERVRRGGVERLAAIRGDVRALPLCDDAADVVTVLEVLEHLHDPAPAAAEALRVARAAVVATVPSHADDNPEHVQLFDGARLERLFLDAGAKTAKIEHVLGHIVCVAITAGSDAGEPRHPQAGRRTASPP